MKNGSLCLEKLRRHNRYIIWIKHHVKQKPFWKFCFCEGQLRKKLSDSWCISRVCLFNIGQSVFLICEFNLGLSTFTASLKLNTCNLTLQHVSLSIHMKSCALFWQYSFVKIAQGSLDVERTKKWSLSKWTSSRYNKQKSKEYQLYWYEVQYIPNFWLIKSA